MFFFRFIIGEGRVKAYFLVFFIYSFCFYGKTGFLLVSEVGDFERFCLVVVI